MGQRGGQGMLGTFPLLIVHRMGRIGYRSQNWVVVSCVARRARYYVLSENKFIHLLPHLIPKVAGHLASVHLFQQLLKMLSLPLGGWSLWSVVPGGACSLTVAWMYPCHCLEHIALQGISEGVFHLSALPLGHTHLRLLLCLPGPSWT